MARRGASNVGGMTSRPPLADRPAEPALFARLIDDAAVFPPGNAPLWEALTAHREHRQAWYAACVGPLLVPASGVAELVHLTDDGGEPVQVSVVGRPEVGAEEVRGAAATLRETPGVIVVGMELGWFEGWRDLSWDRDPLSLEVPRGDAQADAIADIAGEANDTVAVQAKFRTGATPTWPWPDERELATFFRTSIDHDLGFKLTGGLHHAVRGSYDGEEQHGILNVLVAVRWALNGEDVDELVPLLAERDPEVLVAHVTRMSAADASIVRAFFTAYGCCGVTDPINELAALGLLEGPA